MNSPPPQHKETLPVSPRRACSNVLKLRVPQEPQALAAAPVQPPPPQKVPAGPGCGDLGRGEGRRHRWGLPPFPSAPLPPPQDGAVAVAGLGSLPSPSSSAPSSHLPTVAAEGGPEPAPLWPKFGTNHLRLFIQPTSRS